MTTKEKIEKQIAKLNQLAVSTGKTTERVHVEICNATQWLANGGYSRYSNQDFDVLNGLVCCEMDYL